MMLDALLKLSSAQALTATAVSTNTIDLGNVTPKRDIGNGEPLGLMVSVGVAADFTTGDETYEFQFIQSANADLSSQDILGRVAVVAGSLTAGARVVIPIPKGSVTKRYIGARYVLAGTTPTVTVDADILPLSMIEEYKAYADAITIS